MFGIDEADAETDIYRWIRKCGAIDKLVKGLEGSEATRAVNHLLSYRNVGQKVEISIISKFVAMELSKKFEGKFLAEAKSHSISFVNPSWNGWVFQIDFFMQLRRAFEKKEDLVLHGSQKKSRGSQSFEVNPNEKTTWKVPNQVEFKDAKDFQGATVVGDRTKEFENAKSIKDGDWLIPLRWNQGCYDVAQLSDTTLRIVQVTIAKSHSLKLRFVRRLIDSLVSIGFTFDTIEVVFVVPSEEVQHFKVLKVDVVGAQECWSINDAMVLGLISTTAS